ncbi:CoA transferase [Actinopolyspora erythraea]|uniref:Carnitine dehydratase n=1 Tax=Actinopolyspora erythraea TaxID=414996 RepID=A0A099D201_9ACTN|nr:CaiB/BaiF CoA-transferase family protein [Actinopolyspora erythraea]ASU80835.1 CoA transferase [Actinopolyspora erythraea]KGI79951.1 carnitine dehydratase [Actinopolyspora erythraea]
MAQSAERAGGSGPLDGVRVVEVAGLGPAPFCAMLLADLGADVVRVDRPGGGGGEDLLNRGKRSVQLDLKHQRGPEALLALAERADVLLEGFRPGVAERLGIGPDPCFERNPALVYGRMTGWGQDGPLARTAGHDIDYIALSGVLHAIGDADGPPRPPVNLLGDFGGGAMYLAVGVLAALLRARAGGGGQVVDASIVDGSAHLATMLHGMLATGGWSTERGTNLLDGGAPFYDVYATSDGRYMAVGALEPQFYERLLEGLGLSGELPDRDDPANWPEIRERLTETFASGTARHWTEVFEGSDACVTQVLSMTEAAAHPHVRARNTLVESGGVTQPAAAPRFSRTPAPPPGGVAEPGAHSGRVLRDWRVADREALLSSGAVHGELGEHS